MIFLLLLISLALRVRGVAVLQNVLLLLTTRAHQSNLNPFSSTNISYRHRAVNLFLRTYREYWLADENVGQEVVIQDLTVS